MEANGLFSNTISVLQKSLNLRSQKHGLLISNISNIDTPNYKAFDIMVEKEMQKTEKVEKKVTLSQTQPNHIQLPYTVKNIPEIQEVEESRYNFREDGNTVDIDKNMTMLAENGLLYNISAQIIAKKFQSLSNTINGGSR